MRMPKLSGSVTVGDRGQIVIPAEAREKLSINSGDKLLVFAKFHGNFLLIAKPGTFEKQLEEMSQDLDSTREQLDDVKKDD